MPVLAAIILALLVASCCPALADSEVQLNNPSGAIDDPVPLLPNQSEVIAASNTSAGLHTSPGPGTVDDTTSITVTAPATEVPVTVSSLPDPYAAVVPIPTVNPVLQQAFDARGIMPMRNTTSADRKRAAEAKKALGLTVPAAGPGGYSISAIPPPGGVPDYWGPYPNYANSPLPVLDGSGNVTPGTGIRKFMDALPGLGPTGSNDLGQYIPVAVSDPGAYPGSDYYEIAVVQNTEKLHRDLPNTTLRQYVQISTTNVTGNHTPLFYPNGSQIRNITGSLVYGVDKPHYLGPLIVARKDVPVRIKFTNYLPPMADGGAMFLPVDTTIMGAGEGPDGSNYTQNRAVLHLHGGNTPWVSDGTPHQWVAPVFENNTAYPKGVSVQYVPDMDNGTEPNGTVTYYYSNNQSARLMFYHDHAYGMTRLGVYAGEAAGYLLQDTVESAMVANGTIPGPSRDIPLVIQDKTFVPNETQLLLEDPTWNWGTGSPDTANGPGDFWFPHVYMPNQNPFDISGANAMGRWDYGPWFWPPFTGLVNGPVDNPYYNPNASPWEAPQNPGTPNPSTVPEAFMDTMTVNGHVYPYLEVARAPYRLRILNAANDRTLNLQIYRADPLAVQVTDGGSGYLTPPNVTFTGGGGSGANATAIIAGGIVTNVNVTNGGSGYAYTPVVTFSGGGGMYAAATAEVNLTTGKVVAIDITDGGMGYTSAPNVTISGGNGTGANATATITGGPVLGVNVTSPGTGYTSAPVVTISGGGGTGALALASINTEVKMVPAVPDSGLPPSWPTDGRDGGVPDPATVGPDWIVIGTEGGFLPGPAVVPSVPIGYDYNRRVITVLNVLNHSLYLGPAERADVVVDFSQVPDGTRLIIYNDAPAPNPGFDSRLDYYTGDPNQTSTGGAPTTLPGYGPNTRTVMQIRVNASKGTAGSFNMDRLNAELPRAYAASQAKPIVPQEAYDVPFNANYPTNISQYVRIQDFQINFTPADSSTQISMDMKPKSIIEDFDVYYGRMNAMLGVEVPRTNLSTQTSIPYYYIDPPTEVLSNTIRGTPIGSLADGTQIWKVTHNGVDTHSIHFHLINVQLINRVGWDGMIKPPEPDELGWKETLKMNPLEDTIVAFQPVVPTIPWELPNSIRPLDPTMPVGMATPLQFHDNDPTNEPVTVINHNVNYGWEYVWHCHLLGHEEFDMMRPMAVAVAPRPCLNLTAVSVGNLSAPAINLTWTDNSISETNFTIQRGRAQGGPWTNITIPSLTGPVRNVTVTYTDRSVVANTSYFYRVMSTNIVGDTTIYPAPAAGYPTMSANSTPSNVAFAGNVTDKIGVYRNGTWYLDVNGNYILNAGDFVYSFGLAGWTAVPGHWNGTAKTQVGVYRNGTWYLDFNGNGILGAGEGPFSFGQPGWTAVPADWNGDGKTEIGVYNNGTWYLDLSGDYVFGPGDASYVFGGAGWTAVPGDWDGDGITEAGVYLNGVWYLDVDGDGALSAGDGPFGFGQPGYTAVTGDWNGDRVTEIGVYLSGTWFLDMSGDHSYGLGDVTYSFGQAGWTAVPGDWNGLGRTEVGVYRNGTWYLDRNGNGTLNPGEGPFSFGQTGWTPLIGNW